MVIADLHWTFDDRGWKRTFQAAQLPKERLAVTHYSHSSQDYAAAFAAAGLEVERRVEPVIDSTTEPFFQEAGMEKTYAKYKGSPLLVVFKLRKP